MKIECVAAALWAASAVCAPALAAGGVPSGKVVEYRYEGLPFDTLELDDGPAQPLPDGLLRVEARFWFRDYLQPGRTLSFAPDQAVPGLVGFGIGEVDDGPGNWTTFFFPWDPSSYHREWATATLSTGGDAGITAWSFGSSYHSPSFSDLAHSGWDGALGGDEYVAYYNYDLHTVMRWSNSGRPGRWTVAVVDSPVPLAPVPEPGSWALMTAGLLGLAWRRARAGAPGQAAPAR